MSDLLLYYSRPNPTTWVYLSSFLTIGLFFIFRRFWSIRNLDVFLLISLAPGLLIVHEGYRLQLAQSESLTVQWNTKRSWQLPSPMPGVQQDALVAETLDMAVGAALPSVVPGMLVASPQQIPPQQTTSQQTTSQRAGVSADPAEPSTDGGAGDRPDTQVTPSDQPLSPTEIQRIGFVYLFFVETLILVRLMLDPLMVRRPLLDPNLNSGGLIFIGISMFVFMMANVVNSDSRMQVTQGPALGPGYALMNMLPAIPTRPISDAPGGFTPPNLSELTPQQRSLARIAKTLAIVAHLMIVTGIVLIANRHFGNLQAGVGCATLYLMLPYTAQMTGRVDHAVPAALLLWAVLSYRRPLIAGAFMGLACGLVYYPLFLLPLWFSFYWQRGAKGFLAGVATMLSVLIACLALDDSLTILEHLQRMFGVLNPIRDASQLRGFWAIGLHPIWRLPVIVAFVILSVFFAIWPAQKNLGALLSGSAAIMVAAQFWHGYGGGLYIAWFLPLLLLTIFRPNLQDRVATKVVFNRNRSSLSRSTT